MGGLPAWQEKGVEGEGGGESEGHGRGFGFKN